VLGVDWDRYEARDVYVVVQTFLESEGKVQEGAIKRVAVYPSDFGLKKMAHEEVHGPDLGEGIELPDDGEETPEITEAIRKYQKQRLKYYYGVIECDSTETATLLYDELDGMVADEMTPQALELRFIPDDLEIPHKPKTVCTDKPEDYELPANHRSALSHSKVMCTWDDEPDVQRTKFMTKRHSEKELAEMDLQAYLASSSDEELDESNVEAYRRTLLGDAADRVSDDDGGKPAADDDGDDDDDDDDSEGEDDMEINVRSDVQSFADKVQKKAEALKSSGRLGQEGLGTEQKKNSWQTYLERKKEKKRQRKQELKEKAKAAKEAAEEKQTEPKKKKWPSSIIPMKGSEADDDREENDVDEADLLLGSGDEGRHFDLKKTKARGQKMTKKKEEEVDNRFEMDISDPRLAKVFSNADFAIDPTNPEYRDSSGMQRVLKEKRGRKRALPEAKGPAKAKTKVQRDAPIQVEESFSLFG
jgi:hypothetical protein